MLSNYIVDKTIKAKPKTNAFPGLGIIDVKELREA